jgi:hypothetical protein
MHLLSVVGICLIVRSCDDFTSVPVSAHSCYSQSSQHSSTSHHATPRGERRDQGRACSSVTYRLTWGRAEGGTWARHRWTLRSEGMDDRFACALSRLPHRQRCAARRRTRRNAHAGVKRALSDSAPASRTGSGGRAPTRRRPLDRRSAYANTQHEEPRTRFAALVFGCALCAAPMRTPV